MQLYWVSLLIQETENSKPWVSSMSTGCINLEEAMKTIKRGKKNFRVLSAWVNIFDENNRKTVVFHECYINALGQVEIEES